MMSVNIATREGDRMDHEKLNQFSEITAQIGSGMDALLKAQELLVQLMCEQCNIPIEMKEKMIDDMYHIIGIKKL